MLDKGDDSHATFLEKTNKLGQTIDSPAQSQTPDSLSPCSQEVTVQETNRYIGKKFGDLIDDIITDHARSDGFDDLQGKGKPLDLEDNLHEDYFLTRTMKNANVLPPWLELQHEIRDAITDLVKTLEHGKVEDLDQRIAAINLKISRYNQQCPSPLLQKPTLTPDNIYSQHNKWA